MTSLKWRAPARASVCGPTGWVPVERMEVVRTGGDAYVRVESTPVAPDADLDVLVAATDLAGLRDDGVAPATVLGTTGRIRTASWAVNGTTMRATIRYAIHGGRFVVLTAVAPEDSASTAEADAIVDSVRFTVPDTRETEVLPMRSSDVDLSSVATEWLTGRPVGRPTAYTITSEEAVGAARHFGVRLLPGTDVSVLDGLEPATRDAVATSAWRSLVARGALTDSSLREALELGVSHDLLVTLVTDDAAAWFAARPDRMVVVTRGIRQHELVLAVHDTAELADLVLAATAPTCGAVRLRSAYRRVETGAVIGGEVAWHQDEPSRRRNSDDGVDLPAEDLRRLLVGLLPAGTDRRSTS